MNTNVPQTMYIQYFTQSDRKTYACIKVVFHDFPPVQARMTESAHMQELSLLIRTYALCWAQLEIYQ